jgi:hypothetical protein
MATTHTPPRRLWRRRRHNPGADWTALSELAKRMQRQELFDAIELNRHRREVARDEADAASRELDELLAQGREHGLATSVEMAELAGMTRQAASKRLVELVAGDRKVSLPVAA